MLSGYDWRGLETFSHSIVCDAMVTSTNWYLKRVNPRKLTANQFNIKACVSKNPPYGKILEQLKTYDNVVSQN